MKYVLLSIITFLGLTASSNASSMDCDNSISIQLDSGFKVSSASDVKIVSSLSQDQFEALRKAMKIKLEKENTQLFEINTCHYRNTTIVVKIDGKTVYSKEVK